jgi:hypothetical protein
MVREAVMIEQKMGRWKEEKEKRKERKEMS